MKTSALTIRTYLILTATLLLVVLGGLNLLVATYASERVWVNFKVFGLTILTFVFIGSQVMWLTRRAETAPAA